jgi:hypothetical protein
MGPSSPFLLILMISGAALAAGPTQTGSAPAGGGTSSNGFGSGFQPAGGGANSPFTGSTSQQRPTPQNNQSPASGGDRSPSSITALEQQSAYHSGHGGGAAKPSGEKEPVIDGKNIPKVIEFGKSSAPESTDEDEPVAEPPRKKTKRAPAKAHGRAKAPAAPPEVEFNDKKEEKEDSALGEGEGDI